MDKAMALLVEVKKSGWLSVAEAARHIDASPSTAQRILATMRDRGFLTQRADRRYGLGAEMSASAIYPPRVSAMRTVLAPLLVELTRVTGETTHLVVLENTQVRYVDCSESPHPFRARPLTGSSMPSHCSAGGKAQLAVLPKRVVRSIYAQGVPPWPFSKITTLEQLETELNEIRLGGYATSIGETEGNMVGLGAAIIGQDGFPLGAITLAIPGARYGEMNEQELAAALMKTAEEGSRSLESDSNQPMRPNSTLRTVVTTDP
ncbi:IclR family transcriptional regulator [Arthrobacter sp.]|uniref:IclR family transcriptional regulator n=1 Tax=Arthrobacter sp. TaxID=1667 RepID=UPI00289FC3B4|nr:IclR family transcriptional regulator [Arthrobacter sp.]